MLRGDEIRAVQRATWAGLELRAGRFRACDRGPQHVWWVVTRSENHAGPIPSAATSVDEAVTLADG